MSTCRRLEIDPYLSPCTKLKSKWIKGLNIIPVTLNLIEEKVGSTLESIGTGDHFLNITPTAQTLSATINQWDYMKLRSFCKAKDTVTKTKHQPTEWEKIFTNPTSDRGLISRIYKELKKHDIKTPNSPIEKWAIELNREFTAEEYRMAERYLSKCSTSLLIREMQIKTTLRYHLTPVRMAKIKTLGTVHVGEDVEQEEHFSTVGGNADWYNHSGKQCHGSSRSTSSHTLCCLVPPSDGGSEFRIMTMETKYEQFTVTGSEGPVLAPLSGTLELSCQLTPPQDAQHMEIRWFRNRYTQPVHLYRNSKDLQGETISKYVERTELLKDDIGKGKVTLRIFKVTVDDDGPYHCFFKDGEFYEEHITEVKVTATRSDIQILMHPPNTKGVMLECHAGGLFPQPHMEWRDSKGEVIPATSKSHSQDRNKLFNMTISLLIEASSHRNVTCCLQNHLTNQEESTHILISGELFSWKIVWITILSTILCVLIAFLVISCVQLYVIHEKVREETLENIFSFHIETDQWDSDQFKEKVSEEYFPGNFHMEIEAEPCESDQFEVTVEFSLGFIINHETKTEISESRASIGNDDISVDIFLYVVSDGMLH
ncbi:hypothetical protein STEG23_021982 [Scotinomys teguina]